MSRPLPTEMYSTNLVRAPRSVWLYPANTSSEMWNALHTLLWRHRVASPYTTTHAVSV